MRRSPIFRFCTHVSSLISAVRAFTVTVGTPSQCDDFPISWTGGQAPFQILVTPFSPSQSLRNISVPASAFSNGKGSYSVSQFPYKAGTQFLLTMSDATGFGSGGTSTILNVSAPIANNNCNTTILSPDFFFSTPLQLQQCNNYVFDTYTGAVLPATITGLIPGGEHVVLSPVTGPNYTWIADVEAGTSLIFFMIDSQGKQGGVSPINTVSPLANTSCLNVNSPSSTASAPSQTSRQSSTAGNAATVGIIAGSVVGGVILLVLLITLGVWYIRKASRQPGRTDGVHEINLNSPSGHQIDYGSHLPLMQHESQSHISAIDPFARHSRQVSFADSFGGGSYNSSATRPTSTLSGKTTSLSTFPHQTFPMGLAPPIHPGTHSQLANAPTGNFAFNDPSLRLPTQPSRLSSDVSGLVWHGSVSDRQTAAAASQVVPSPPAHVIVHTDIEDTSGPSDVMELPPRYTERRPLTSQSPPAPNHKSSRS